MPPRTTLSAVLVCNCTIVTVSYVYIYAIYIYSLYIFWRGMVFVVQPFGLLFGYTTPTIYVYFEVYIYMCIQHHSK